MLFLMMKTLIGSLYFTGGGEFRHQHREAAVADDATHLPLGIRHLAAPMA